MSKIICHAHCPRGSHRGAAVLVVLAAVGAAALCAAVHRAAPAIDSAARTALHVLEIVAITLAAAAALAGAGWIASAALRARASQTTAHHTMPRHTPIGQRAVEALSAPREPLAIEAPRPYAAETSGVTDVAAPAYSIEEQQ
jgi:hypothetical protein